MQNFARTNLLEVLKMSSTTIRILKALPSVCSFYNYDGELRGEARELELTGLNIES